MTKASRPDGPRLPTHHLAMGWAVGESGKPEAKWEARSGDAPRPVGLSRTPPADLERTLQTVRELLNGPEGEDFHPQVERSIRDLKAYLVELDRQAPEALVAEFRRSTKVDPGPLDAEATQALGTELKTFLREQTEGLVSALERERLGDNALAQWAHALKETWAGKSEHLYLPEAIATLFRVEDWKGNRPIESAARFGNVGDLAASATGVASALATGNYGELIRLLITVSGVTGGYINDRLAKDPLPDDQARAPLAQAVRPGQHPNRAGFLAYTPAAVAFLGSGVAQNASSENLVNVFGAEVNAAGMGDIIGGTAMLAGFGAAIMMRDPRTGKIVDRIAGSEVKVEPQSGLLLDREGQPLRVPAWHVPDLVVKDGDRARHMNVFEFASLPVAERPEIREVLIRKPVTIDVLNNLRNATVTGFDRLSKAVKGRPKARSKGDGPSLKFSRAKVAEVGAVEVDVSRLSQRKSKELSRFQILSAFTTVTTYMGWASLVDRVTRADWPTIGQGLASGDVSSPMFWQSVFELGTVALQGLATGAYTITNVQFARSRSQDAKTEPIRGEPTQDASAPTSRRN